MKNDMDMPLRPTTNQPSDRQRTELFEQLSECDRFEPQMEYGDIRTLADSGMCGDRRIVWLEGDSGAVLGYRYSGPETVSLGGYVQGRWMPDEDEDFSTFSPHIEAMI